MYAESGTNFFRIFNHLPCYLVGRANAVMLKLMYGEALFSIIVIQRASKAYIFKCFEASVILHIGTSKYLIMQINNFTSK